MLDMGPYYLTCLVNLLGPVRALTGAVQAAHTSRSIATGPRAGQSFAVTVPTHISGILEFDSGAQVTITTSFDVWSHGHNPIELYGRTGSMLVADPNQFQGEIRVAAGKGDWMIVEQAHRYGDGNYRILGLADMATAIRGNRPHRASLELSLHVLEIMTGILASAEQGQRLELNTRCDRPAALPADLPFGVLD